MTKRVKVYGHRICPICKGFCHENSWRYKSGLRKKYYCCEGHVNIVHIDKLRKAWFDLGAYNWREIEITDQELTEWRNEFYEQIDVISH